MNIEDQILTICSRQDFESSHQQKIIDICREKNICWDKVLKTADLHGVAPLAYVNLTKHGTDQLGIPPNILKKLKFIFLGNVIRKQKTEAVIQRVLALFAENSIDVMLVKGAALNFSHIYDQAWYTVSADVDLVIKPKRDELSKAEREILIGEFDRINHTLDPHIEHLEYDFFEHHDVTMNNVVKIDSKKIWQDGHQIQIGGHPVYVMSTEDMLIATGINACRKRFFRLKNLLDISAIVRKNPGMDWERFINKTHEYQCDNIIYTALFLAQRILGINFHEGVLDDLEVNQTRKTLIKKVFNSLSQRSSLLDLVAPSEGKVLGRALNRSLFLTYATYSWDQIGRKLIQLTSSQRV